MDLKKEIENIQTDWKHLLLSYYNDDNKLKELEELKNNNPKKIFYPPINLIFNAFTKFNLNETKVVILGQDPYYNKGQAMGLSFSVPNNIKTPKSLVNIYKELNSDNNVEFTIPKHGDLTQWANQGVLLLNTALTVQCNKPNEHKKYWQNFTNKIIKKISDDLYNVVFILWGNNAKSKIDYIDEKKHLILQSAHPSPLSASRGFFGCEHFSKTNDYLIKHNKEPINWQL